MSKYILAHDLGTSGNKATLFSVLGEMIGSSVTPYDTHYFNEKWVEQSPNDWWDAVCNSTKQLINEYSIEPEEISVVSFSGQMMGCLCVDINGEPLRNSIIWADQRAQKQVKDLEQYLTQEEFYQIVGHRNTASYGIQKLMWIRDNEPDIYAETYKVLNAKDYIVLKLTNNYYTDYSDGNGMGCFDLVKLEWSEKIIEYSKIDPNKLPNLKPSTFIAGKVTAEASKLSGLAIGTPVVIGAGDGVTANIGAGSISEGKTYCSLGTSAWITTTSKQPVFDPDMRIVTWAHAIPGYYAPNGTMQYAGGAFNWMKETICTSEELKAAESESSVYDYINKQIVEAVPGSNGLIFLPYLLGERAPRWDSVSKGAYIGIKSETTRGDMLRSVLEGVTYNLAIILDILRKHIDIEEMIVIGGGAKSEVWRQIMADVFGLTIKVPNLLDEAGSMGAAIIGGVGVGLYDDFDVINQFITINGTQSHNRENEEIYNCAKQQFDDFYFSLREVFEKQSIKTEQQNIRKYYEEIKISKLSGGEVI
ncbi:xylulokinase [Cytobacillus purgationiresistens]|uniref:Xylulose kinase n=1 Tax=Cytobacillus purgationiresistens TaxID=863449 RepID=A0ABU0AID1_9BACI|nr:xylulokinase [Cytobacillus purgationiresistens]MDQ0271013.1 xylulokinase [Cytobacillus purgationiresistens]